MITVKIITTAGRMEVAIASGTTVGQVLHQNGVETNMKNSINNVPVGLDYPITERDVTAKTFTNDGCATLTVVKAITGN